jgi:16S rRNA (adenine1518-N6/adenine1519-N6)-dimethyltransferase
MRELNYDSPQSIRAFLDARGLGMRKKFGQNFLINPNARAKLIDALGAEKEDAVWEVGPGLGAMTALLLEKGSAINAFEIDAGFCAALKEFFGDNPRFRLIEGDALKTWAQNPPGDFFMGNLPYTVAAALIGLLIEKNRFFKRMTVTVQKEVADRITAKPKTKNYSSFSVLCASAYTARPLMTLKGASFYPAPHVDSQALCLDLRTDIDPASAYPAHFRALVRRLFASRRKTIKNNLADFLIFLNRLERGKSEDILFRCGIGENERAENLGIEDFVKLSACIDEMVKTQEAFEKT